MKHKISCVILLLSQYSFAQMDPANTTVQDQSDRAIVTINENPIDSSIVNAVTPPKHTGNPSHVFTDDTGCSRQHATPKAEFSKMLQTINIGKNDDLRLLEAFRLTRKSCLNATQIAQICKSFTLEKTRLEFAKFAYSACVDPKNYDKVSAVLTKKTYLDDLRWFISGK